MSDATGDTMRQGEVVPRRLFSEAVEKWKAMRRESDHYRSLADAFAFQEVVFQEVVSQASGAKTILAYRELAFIEDAERRARAVSHELSHRDAAIQRWRDRALRAEAAVAQSTAGGRCGDPAPAVAGFASSGYCALPHGHGGWHRDDSTPPSEWNAGHKGADRG